MWAWWEDDVGLVVHGVGLKCWRPCAQAVELFRQHAYSLRRQIVCGTSSERRRLINGYMQARSCNPRHESAPIAGSVLWPLGQHVRKLVRGGPGLHCPLAPAHEQQPMQAEATSVQSTFST